MTTQTISKTSNAFRLTLAKAFFKASDFFDCVAIKPLDVKGKVSAHRLYLSKSIDWVGDVFYCLSWCSDHNAPLAYWLKNLFAAFRR